MSEIDTKDLRTALAENIAGVATAHRARANAARIFAGSDVLGDGVIGALSAADEALFQAGQRVVEAANAIVEAAAGAAMVKAIEDLSTRDPAVLAWRAARNALITDAEAALPGELVG